MYGFEDAYVQLAVCFACACSVVNVQSEIFVRQLSLMLRMHNAAIPVRHKASSSGCCLVRAGKSFCVPFEPCLGHQTALKV